jgi:hypothetical protein
MDDLKKCVKWDRKWGEKSQNRGLPNSYLDFTILRKKCKYHGCPFSNKRYLRYAIFYFVLSFDLKVLYRYGRKKMPPMWREYFF